MKLFEPQGLLIILVIVLLIFGPKQLPDLGKAIGKTMKSIREGMEDDEPAASKDQAEDEGMLVESSYAAVTSDAEKARQEA